MSATKAARQQGDDSAPLLSDAPLLTDDLLAQGAVCVAELDLVAGHVLRLSPALTALLGCGADDPAARQLLLLAGPLEGGQMGGASGHLRGQDGSFAHVRLSRLDLWHGRALLLIGEDVGVQADPTEERCREIYDNAAEGIYRSSLDGRQLTANPALVRMNGYSSEDEFLAAVRDIATEWYVEPNRRAVFVREMELHGQVTDFVSEVYRHRTRERVWISENARLVRDKVSGAPLYYEGTVRDVTDMVRRLQIEVRLRTIVETIADGVVSTDVTGVIRSANRAAATMFARPEAEMIGQHIGSLLVEPMMLPLPGAECRVQGKRRDATRFPLDVTLAEARGPEAPMRIYCLRDATERLRYEARLREAKEAAEQANRAKSDFLAVISHELRTPLNAVIGMTGLLLDGPLEQQPRRHAETLHDAAEHLLTLINDVLDFSKLDAGRLQLERIDFDPRAVVRGVCDLLAPRAQAKGIDLRAEVGPQIPARLVGDPGRLRQVLLNLVGNAIKFTERGAVSIELARKVAMAGACELSFAVRDSGIGIAAEHLPLLFKEFHQADSSVSRRFGGTGLGLAICARLVAAMGGSIGVTSAPEQGSLFRFSVRLDEADPTITAPARPELAGCRLRLLVAEDNPANQLLIRTMIERLGHHADLVATGLEAVQAVRMRAPYDAVLMDVMMPELDGIAATRLIRRLPPPRGRVPVLGLTAHVSADEHAEFRTAGMDAVLTKPITATALAAAFAPMAQRLMAAGDA